MPQPSISRIIIPAAICASLTVAVGWVMVDRLVWVQEGLGAINARHAGFTSEVCPAIGLIEVAPGSTQGKLRFRCGGILWPTYSAGESAELFLTWSRLRVQSQEG
jgi:hypothetical protein